MTLKCEMHGTPADQFVELGKASELTGLLGSPVRDNNHQEPMEYWDASKQGLSPESGEYDI